MFSLLHINLNILYYFSHVCHIGSYLLCIALFKERIRQLTISGTAKYVRIDGTHPLRRVIVWMRTAHAFPPLLTDTILLRNRSQRRMVGIMTLSDTDSDSDSLFCNNMKTFIPYSIHHKFITCDAG